MFFNLMEKYFVSCYKLPAFQEKRKAKHHDKSTAIVNVP